MTTGLSYDGTVAGTNSYVAQIANMAVVSPTDPNFLIALPQIISYSENRMCRDIDFLSTKTSATFLMTAGQRSLSLAGATPYPFVVTEQFNIITPSTSTNPNDVAATRNPCLPTTKEFLDQVYGSAAVANQGLPIYIAPFTDNTFYFGPPPDAAYTVEVVGTARPESLSASNLTTFISLFLPDLMIQCSLIYLAEYQRNFSGASSNDPQMGTNYESQYISLMKSAQMEEARKKFQSTGWASLSPAAAATPTRGA